MYNELLNQAPTIFDSFEKWNAFLELANQKDLLQAHYLKKVKQPLQNYFNANPVEGWICEPWGDPNYDFRWYLTEFGKNSLGLTLAWRFEFHLRLEDTIEFDTEKINELLKSEYSVLLSAFDHIHKQFEENTKAMEYRNYHFEGYHQSNFDNAELDKFAWYAGNDTANLVQQIIQKVDRFRKDENLTRMLQELNSKAKKG